MFTSGAKHYKKFEPIVYVTRCPKHSISINLLPPEMLVQLG